MISGIPEPIVKALAHRPAFIWSNRVGITLDCGCIPKGHMIYTENGMRDISEIKENDMVYSHDCKYHKVTKTFKRSYNGDMIKIVLNKFNTPISLTPDHPVMVSEIKNCCQPSIKHLICRERDKCYGKSCFKFLCRDIKWIRADEITKNHYVIFPVSKSTDNLVDCIDISKYINSEIEINDTKNTIISCNKSANNTKSIPRLVPLSNNIMRLFGFYVSEGSPSSGNGIDFSFNSNETNFILEIKETIKNIFGLDVSIRHVGNNTTVRVFSRILSESFSNMFGSGAKNKKIPNEIMNANEKKYMEFISAMVDGDGHSTTRTNGRTTYILSTTSHELSLQTLHLLNKSEIYPSMNKVKNNRGFSKSNGFIYRIIMEGNNANKYMDFINESNKNISEFQYEMIVAHKNMNLIPVKKTYVEQFKGNVYNFEVDGTNSYICEKMVVHNCNDGSLVQYGHEMLYPTVKFNHDMPWLYSFDLDAWNLPNCIRGDAHRMPFIDNAFDTVVMGDVLEHMPNPIQALQEAERVSSQRLVITLPNEARWHRKLSPFRNSTDLMSETEQEDQTIRHPSIYSKCKDFVKEEKIRHLPHIHSFDFFTIHELLSKGLSKQYMVDISNLYHPLVQKTSDDPSDMPYWGIVVYLTTDLLNFRYGITNLG